MFEVIAQSNANVAAIKVMGIGGGGGNAVEHMVRLAIKDVDFICANTDAQALMKLTAENQIQLGVSVTKGLGAGTDPGIGRASALESRDKIVESLTGADMLFITAGMGGGTGTGAAPVVAEIAREMGILTVAVVTKPFAYEGKKRMLVAEQGIAEISRYVDSLITIPNDKLDAVLGAEQRLLDAFAAADDVLASAVTGIADVIVRPGLINVDFADVRTVMAEMGMAMMGNGRAAGEDRAIKAAKLALASPLLENVDITDARGILINVAANDNILSSEFREVGATIGEFASEDATVVIGAVIDESLGDELKVTLVATGLGPVVQDLPSPELLGDARRKAVEVAIGTGDYRSLERPTVIRNAADKDKEDVNISSLDDLDLLDVPAFLRRQAD